MLTTVIPHFIKPLLVALPLNAEENSVREDVCEADLVRQICSSNDDLSAVQVEALVELMRRIFESLELLDLNLLHENRWAFVSFPASLLARSILETLSTEKNSFFPLGYWAQGGIPQELVEKQRILLSSLERHRINSHSSTPAEPIRTVHAAWGVIKLGGKFLLHRREDRFRDDVKNYVFPGGRLDLQDLSARDQSPAGLRDLFQIDSVLAKKGFPSTLSREISEELGLGPSEYRADHLRTLSPYKKLEGPRNNHVYTQYDIEVYSLRLPPDSELTVLDKTASEEGIWSWFSIEQLEAGKRSDGEHPFIDALSEELGEEVGAFLAEDIPDSSSYPLAFRGVNNSIEFRVSENLPIKKGDTGNEKSSDFWPNEDEWKLLMILGWQSRELDIQVRNDALVLLGGSWVKLRDANLISVAQQLAQKLERGRLRMPFLEVEKSGLCRLSIDPELIYFSPECFQYSWQLEGAKKSVLLTLREIDAHWATLEERRVIIPLSPQVSDNIRLLEKEGGSNTPIGANPEREFFRKFEPAQSLGLRKFIEISDGYYDIVVPEYSEM